jgi:hypothetical protein
LKSSFLKRTTLRLAEYTQRNALFHVINDSFFSLNTTFRVSNQLRNSIKGEPKTEMAQMGINNQKAFGVGKKTQVVVEDGDNNHN